MYRLIFFSDCKPPRYSTSVIVIGTQYQLGSTITVKCRDGFMASANGAPISEIRCSMNGSWTGGSIVCKGLSLMIEKYNFLFVVFLPVSRKSCV